MNISLDYFRIQQAESLWFLSCGTSSVVFNPLTSFLLFHKAELILVRFSLFALKLLKNSDSDLCFKVIILYFVSLFHGIRLITN
jgi:hypothetical protein